MGQVRNNRRLVGVAAAAVIVGATSLAGASSASAVPTSAVPTSAVPACAGPSLVVSHSGIVGGDEHAEFILRFRNKSHTSCRIHGYPGFDALGPRGGVLGRATRTQQGYFGGSTKGVPSVTLRPGHYASAGVEWLDTNPDGGVCVRSTTVAYTPAGTTKTVTRAASVARCSLEVHPTVPGKSGEL